tara:strand:+ start:60858 stop:61022 length:165 start_codon:yes stop_codon:yes gene_type:complete
MRQRVHALKEQIKELRNSKDSKRRALYLALKGLWKPAQFATLGLVLAREAHTDL